MDNDPSNHPEAIKAKETAPEMGFSRLLPMYESTDGYLAPIDILPEYRRKGLAKELLKMSMLKLKESNY
ncbi:MAG: GNAT family N-acetyltransferase [Candidatus Heimdallarchaeota archaeon]